MARSKARWPGGPASTPAPPLARLLGRVGEVPEQAGLGAVGAVHERGRGRHAQVRPVGAREAPRAAIDDHAPLEHEPAADLLVGQVGRMRQVLDHPPHQLVGAEAQQRAQRAVDAHQPTLGREQRHGHGRHVEGAIEARERGLAARVDAAAGDERVEADLELVGAERLDHAVVGSGQQQAGHVVARRREGHAAGPRPGAGAARRWRSCRPPRRARRRRGAGRRSGARPRARRPHARPRSGGG